MKSVTPALALSMALLAAAPFWGVAVELLRRNFPQRLLLVLGVFFGLALLIVVVSAIATPGARLRRLGLIAVALLLAAVPAFGVERESATTVAVERIHLVLYTLITLLFYRGLKDRPSWGRWSVLGAWAACALVGLLDEGVQWLVPVRTGEIYDVGLNLYSALCGVLVSVALLGGPTPGWPAPGRRRVAVLLAFLILGVAGFFHIAHLGHPVEDAEVGSFQTLVPPSRFAEINRERRERWQREPPGPPFEPLALEDHFLSEAGWRIRHRNQRVEGGDLRSAWFENRILEIYFPAALDIPDRRGGVRHRWSPEQRRSIAAAVDRSQGGYRSPVLPGRIYVEPRPVTLWGGALLGTALVLLLGRGRRS